MASPPVPELGGTGWFGQPSTPPSQPPPVLGTEQLQKAIDRFDAAVDKLAKLYSSASGSLPGTPGGGASGVNGGGSRFNGVSSGGGGFLGGKYNIGHLAEEAAGIVGIHIPMRGPAAQTYGNWGGLVGGGSSNGGGATFSGTSGAGTPGGYAQPGSSPASVTGVASHAPATFSGQPMGSPGGAGGAGGGYLGGSGYSGGGPAQPGGGGFLSGGGGDIASGALSLMASFTSYGKASMPIQMAMSQMQQQGNLLAPSYAQGSNQYGDKMRGAAFGSNNTNPNNFAMNASDAAQGYSILQQMAGSGIASSTSTGRFGLGAAASFAGANPNMSYASAAALGQSMAMPSMSLRMTQAGYRTTPMKLGGGGANSFGSVIGSMMQRWYPGQGWVKPQNMAASLMPGQVGNQNLTSLGYSPDQVQALSSTMEAYNQVGYRSGLSASKVQSVFQGAQSGNKSDLALLAKDHVTQSDLSQLKKYQAQGTMNQSDTYDSFTSGLNGTVDALTKFKQILNNIVNIPGINQIVGGGGGVMGTLGHAAGDFKDVGEGAFGLGMVGLGASKMFGGGGGAGGILSSLTGGKFGGGGGGLLGMLGLMDPEVVAAVAAGQGLSGLLGGGGSGGSGAGSNPLGTLGNVRATNNSAQGRWSANTMNVTANVVNIISKGGAGSSGSGSSGSGGGGILGKLNPLNWFVGSADAVGRDVGHLSEGGIIPGFAPGVDDRPAMLSKGEAVLNPIAALKLGHDNIRKLNSKYRAGRTQMKSGVLHAADGTAILADARKYNGHKYVYGGPSNPTSGFDCSSFASYILGHDEGLSLPGGTWASTTASGTQHGDVASQFLNLPGTHKVSHNAADIQQGDVLVWSSHVGFGVGPGVMFSAYDTASGVLQTGKDLKNANGPTGEQLTIMRYGAGGGTAPASSSTKSSSGGGISFSGGGGANSLNESDNVAAALGGGSGGSGPVTPATSGTTATSSQPASGGTASTGLLSVGKFLMAHGYNKASAAGAAGVVGGEAGPAGDPESTGTGGAGLIGWTPPSAMVSYGGTCKAAGIGNLSTAQDMANQENAMLKWMSANGWGPSVANKYTDPVKAAYAASAAYERPAVAGSDVHADIINGVYAKLGTGGNVRQAGPYIVGERGTEIVNLPAGAQVTSAKRTQIAGAQGVAQVPWMASRVSGSPAAGLGGINVTLEFAPGSITISQDSGTNSRESVSNSAREIFSKVADMMHSEEMYTAIRNGMKSGQ